MPELTTIVREQEAAVRQLLEQIELRQPSSAHYGSFWGFLNALCDRVGNEVEAVSRLSANTSSAETELVRAQQQLLLFCSHVLRELHSYCESFDHADLLVIPTPMMQLLNKFTRAIGGGKPFVLRGTTYFNYMYNPIGKKLNRLASSLSEDAPTLDENFSIVSFPLANSRNILANCALIHELGHLLVDSLDLIQRLTTDLPPQAKADVEIIVQRHAQISPQADFGLVDRISDINEVLGNWIHESLADVIGLHLLGPAHLFSFMYWIQSLGSHNTDDHEHPCNSYRLALMMNEVENLGWQDLFRQETPDVWDNALRIAGLGREVGELRFNAAAECLPVLQQPILNLAQGVCREATYRPETLMPAKGDMLALLKRGIPPAEMLHPKGQKSRQFDAVSILNTGWLFYEKGFPTWGERFSHLNAIKYGELLSRLLTKAIEISFVMEISSRIDPEGNDTCQSCQ